MTHHDSLTTRPVVPASMTRAPGFYDGPEQPLEVVNFVPVDEDAPPRGRAIEVLTEELEQHAGSGADAAELAVATLLANPEVLRALAGAPDVTALLARLDEIDREAFVAALDNVDPHASITTAEVRRLLVVGE